MPVEDLRAAGFGDEVEKVATAVAAYLDAVRDVGDTFTTAAEIPPLDAGEIETVVEAYHGPDLAGESVDVDRLTRLVEGRPVEAPLQGPAERELSGTDAVASGRSRVRSATRT